MRHKQAQTENTVTVLLFILGAAAAATVRKVNVRNRPKSGIENLAEPNF